MDSNQLILPFRPSLLLGPKPYNRQKKLRRWCKKLKIQGRGSNNRRLRHRLLELIAFYHKLGVPIYHRPENPSNSPMSRINKAELDDVVKWLDTKPFYDQNFTWLKRAYENRVVLEGFHLSEFLESFKSVRVEKGGPFQGRPIIRWRAEDGPRMLVDEEGIILFLYLPGYVAPDYANDLSQELRDLCALTPPTWDRGSQDCRAQKWVPLALRYSRRLAGEAPIGPTEQDWRDIEQLAPDFHEGAGSWHHTLGWFPRGQCKKGSPRSSRELVKDIDDPRILRAKLHFYMWKELIDLRLNDLIRRLHPEFHQVLSDLQHDLQRHGCPPPEFWEVWHSVFSFLSVGFNRQTGIHRDAGGMRGGLDALFLTGDFTGGDLYLQDFGLEVEWRSGDFCCFDGKTFSHAVRPWEGTERNCFIYFTHANVAQYFYLSCSVPFPNLSAFALANGFD